VKIGIATDPHGIMGIVNAERQALEHGCDAMIITGDCWDVNHGRRIPTHYMRGNHEMEKFWQHAALEPPHNVTLHEDYTQFQLDGIKFGVLGRMDDDTHKHLYPENGGRIFLGHPENRAFEKIKNPQAKFKGVDVMLFHDAPWPFMLTPQEDHFIGSPYLTDILKHVQPKLAFHGHQHMLEVRPVAFTDVFGLAPCDVSFGLTSFAILDTKHLTVDLRSAYH
jgi:Icc-related predicted phosphoesterase